MTPLLSFVVCLPALASILGIGLWVWVDYVRYNAEPSEAPVPEGMGRVWVSSSPVQTPTTEIAILPASAMVRSHRAHQGVWS